MCIYCTEDRDGYTATQRGLKDYKGQETSRLYITGKTMTVSFKGNISKFPANFCYNCGRKLS